MYNQNMYKWNVGLIDHLIGHGHLHCKSQDTKHEPGQFEDLFQTRTTSLNISFIYVWGNDIYQEVFIFSTFSNMTKYVGKAVWNYPLQFWNRPATNLMRAVCQKKFEKLDRDQVLRQVSLVHLTSIAGLLV